MNELLRQFDCFGIREGKEMAIADGGAVRQGEAVEELVKKKDWAALREALRNWPPPETADLLAALDKVDRALLFRALPRHLSTEVFVYLSPEEENALLKDLTDEETRRLLASLRPDDRTLLFEELPGQATQKLLNLLDAEEREEARQLLGYPEHTVGRLMTPDYVAVRPEWTIAQALEHIRQKGADSETINEIYVTDDSWRLIDALSLRRFILAGLSESVSRIMDHVFVSLSAFDDREEAVRVMQRHDLEALPVVDSGGVLVGIVTFDDVLDVAQAEATEDFHKVGAVAPLRRSYAETGLLSLYRKRIGWLVGLVFANLFSGAAIALFEDAIAAAVTLVFFLPLLIGSSGNAGSQSATLMVRSLAMGDVKMGDWARLLFKEVGIAALLGTTMGLAVWGVGFYRGGFDLGAVVAVTMIAVVMVGSLLGVSLPFLLDRFKLDPATASGPLITSLSDIAGVLIYFSIATKFLSL